MKKTFKRHLSFILSLAIILGLCNFSITNVTAKNTYLSENPQYPVTDIEIPTDGAESVFYLQSADIKKGTKIYYEFDFVKPSWGTNTSGDTSQDFYVRATMRNQSSSTFFSNLADINANYIIIGGEKYRIIEAGGHYGDTTAGTIRMNFEIDIPNGKYMANIYFVNGSTATLKFATPWVSIPGSSSVTDWSQTQVEALGFLNGSRNAAANQTTKATTKVSNQKVYYSDGAVDLIDVETEQTVDGTTNKEIVVAKDLTDGTGEYVYFEMDFKKPTSPSDTSAFTDWQTHHNVRFEMNGGTEGYIFSKVAGINYNFLYVGGEMTSDNRIRILDVASDIWLTLKLEMDIPNKKIVTASVINKSTGAIIGTKTNIAAHEFGGVKNDWPQKRVKGVNVLEGEYIGSITAPDSSMTFKNVRLYYKQYNLSATASAGGSVLKDGAAFTNAKVKYSDTTTLTFQPNDGYKISTVTVGGVDVTSQLSSNTYTISSIAADTAVAVTFAESTLEYVNPTEAVTLATNGSKVILRPETPTPAGADATFMLPLGRPTCPTGTSDQEYYYTISAKLDANGTEKTVTLAELNHNYLRHIGAAAANRNQMWHGATKIKLHFDMENDQYLVSLLDVNGVNKGTYAIASAIPESIDGATARVKEIILTDVSAPEGSSWVIDGMTLAYEVVNPTEAVTLGTVGNAVSVTEDEETAGANQTISLDVLLPTSDANKDAFVINATVKSGDTTVEKPILYFDANRPSIDKTNALKNDSGSSIWIHSSPKNSDGTTNLKFEFDWANAKYRMIAGNYANHTSVWLDLPFGLSSYADAGISKVSVLANNPVAGDSATISNLEIKRGAKDFINPTAPAKLEVIGDAAKLQPAAVKYGVNQTFSMTVEHSITDEAPRTDFAVKAKIKENADSAAVEGILFYFDNWRILKADATNSIGFNITDCGVPATLTVEFDLAAGQYRLVSKTGKQSSSEWFALPQSFESYAAAGIEEVSVSATDVLLNGDYATISDMQIYTAAYNVTTTITGNGSVTSHGNAFLDGAYSEGDQYVLAFTPDAGYEIGTVIVNGTAVTLTNGTYTLTITGETAIAVTFNKSKNIYEGNAYTIDAADEDIYFIPDEVHNGKYMTFNFDMGSSRGC